VEEREEGELYLGDVVRGGESDLSGERRFRQEEERDSNVTFDL
jgi:hypothetical protein